MFEIERSDTRALKYRNVFTTLTQQFPRRRRWRRNARRSKAGPIRIVLWITAHPSHKVLLLL